MSKTKTDLLRQYLTDHVLLDRVESLLRRRTTDGETTQDHEALCRAFAEFSRIVEQTGTNLLTRNQS